VCDHLADSVAILMPGFGQRMFFVDDNKLAVLQLEAIKFGV